MTVPVTGTFAGGLMTGPSSAQLAEANRTGRLTVAGAHTVGAPDGGPGLPVVGWSTTHGDLRVAHFVGLHAVQALPILTILVLRSRSERHRVRWTVAAGGIYACLFLTLLLQALAGAPLLAREARRAAVYIES